MKELDTLEERPSELLGLRLSPTEKRIVRELAEATGTTASKIGRRAIQEFIGLRNREAPVSENP